MHPVPGSLFLFVYFLLLVLHVVSKLQLPLPCRMQLKSWFALRVSFGLIRLLNLILFWVSISIDLHT